MDRIPVVTSLELPVGIVRWPSRRALTVVLKATYDIRGNGPLEYAPVQRPLCAAGDVEDGPSGPYPSDFVPFKPKADVLLVGHARSTVPATEVSVQLRVGSWFRIITATSAVPTTEIPLAEAWLRDPTTGDRVRTGPSIPPAPDTPDAAWLDRDYDFETFNAATSEQRLAKVEPNARVVVDGVFRDGGRRALTLPPTRPHAALVFLGDGTINLNKMRLDTVWLDSDQEVCVVVWRSVHVFDAAPFGEPRVVVVDSELQSRGEYAALAAQEPSQVAVESRREPAPDSFEESLRQTLLDEDSHTDRIILPRAVEPLERSDTQELRALDDSLSQLPFRQPEVDPEVTPPRGFPRPPLATEDDVLPFRTAKKTARFEVASLTASRHPQDEFIKATGLPFAPAPGGATSGEARGAAAAPPPPSPDEETGKIYSQEALRDALPFRPADADRGRAAFRVPEPPPFVPPPDPLSATVDVPRDPESAAPVVPPARVPRSAGGRTLGHRTTLGSFRLGSASSDDDASPPPPVVELSSRVHDTTPPPAPRDTTPPPAARDTTPPRAAPESTPPRGEAPLPKVEAPIPGQRVTSVPPPPVEVVRPAPPPVVSTAFVATPLTPAAVKETIGTATVASTAGGTASVGYARHVTPSEPPKEASAVEDVPPSVPEAPTLTIERYAELKAELWQAGASRPQILAKYELGELAWKAEDDHWREQLALESKRGESTLVRVVTAALMNKRKK